MENQHFQWVNQLFLWIFRPFSFDLNTEGARAVKAARSVTFQELSSVKASSIIGAKVLRWENMGRSQGNSWDNQ